MIGGSYQKGNWDTTPDPNMTQRMLKRAIEVCPQLVKPGQGVEGLDIVRVYAALRPLRIGGVRLEKEEIDGVTVVHNYGAGGFGCGSPSSFFLPLDTDPAQSKQVTGWPSTRQDLWMRPRPPRQSCNPAVISG